MLASFPRCTSLIVAGVGAGARRRVLGKRGKAGVGAGARRRVLGTRGKAGVGAGARRRVLGLSLIHI